MNKCISAVLICLALQLGGNVGYARTLTFDNQDTTVYSLSNDRIAPFVANLLADLGIKFDASSALKNDRRTLNGTRQGTAQDILNSIVASTGILLYYDGTTVFGYSESEKQRSYVSIETSSFKAIMDSLTALNLADNDNQFTGYASSGLIELSGAPAFIDQIIELVDTLTGHITTEQDVRFIPLKYAWATDHEYNLGSNTVSVPGIATLLSNTYAGTKTDQTVQTQASTGRNFNQALRAGKLVEAEPKTKNKDEGATNQVAFRSEHNPTEVNIVADPYHNAIILRGPRNVLTQYERLISSLDTPVRIIEIEATIIDVNNDAIQSLGVDWYGAYEDVELGLNQNAGSQAGLLSALIGTSSSLTGQTGLNLGVIVNDDFGIAARLSALETEGALKVVSKPRVATLDDLEASIESSKSAYVSVPGAYEVDLFEVFSGTVLRVTPHIIDDDYDRKLRLLVSVQDGSLELSGGNALPVTSNNAVNTQAIVKEGASLLLGGLNREEQITEQSGVPLLQHIPILGHLFKSSRTVTKKTERMFLITPRIVDYDGSIETATNVDISDNSAKDCGDNCKEQYQSENIHLF